MSIVIPSLRAAVAVPGWAKNALWRNARAVPSLDLRFADNKSLVDAVTGASLVTFTRASSGTFVDSAGVLQTAAIDVPRFDHNPTTGESLGLLVEEARTNLALGSEEFNDASWAKVGATVTANTGAAPNGATTADLFTRTTTGVSYATQTFTKAASAIQYTFSVFVKQSVGNFCALRVQGTYPSRVDVVFNLSSATISTAASVFGSFTGPSASITPYANGWYRLTVTATSDAGVALQVLASFNSNGIVVDGTDSVSNSAGLLWGAQLEAGAFPTSYIPTTTAAATRSADVASITGTAFSGWYRQDEGTFYGEATGLSGGATITVRASADAGERMQFNNGLGQTAVIASGVAQVLFGSPGTNKQAFAFKANDFAQKRVGFALETDSSGTLPVVNMATIGKFDFGGQDSLNGRIRRLVFWPVRSPNTTLETLTQ